MRPRAIAFLLLAAMALAAPPGTPAKTLTQAGGQPSRPPRQRFIRGTVISVNAKEHMLVVRLDGIPGYKSPMTMRYSVGLQEDLKKISPGDRIEANDVGDVGITHLEKIIVIAHPGDSDNPK